jgi:hypothetical protein
MADGDTPQPVVGREGIEAVLNLVNRADDLVLLPGRLVKRRDVE